MSEQVWGVYNTVRKQWLLSQHTKQRFAAKGRQHADNAAYLLTLTTKQEHIAKEYSPC